MGIRGRGGLVCVANPTNQPLNLYWESRNFILVAHSRAPDQHRERRGACGDQEKGKAKYRGYPCRGSHAGKRIPGHHRIDLPSFICALPARFARTVGPACGYLLL